jgi:hypothetical protein
MLQQRDLTGKLAARKATSGLSSVRSSGPGQQGGCLSQPLRTLHVVMWLDPKDRVLGPEQ